ncbi:hypothetical protein F4679DRAFT_585991 [Xylaria curta]|nr:hypothetical protein F4679DRAFT_585991 [Xylaria curta]
MASSWTPEDDNRSYTHRDTMRNGTTADSSEDGHPDPQASLQQAIEETAWWKRYANRMKHERDLAKADTKHLKRSLNQFRSLRHFDPQIHQIVSRSFATQATEAQNMIESLQKEIMERTNESNMIVSFWQGALQELDEAKSSNKFLIIDDDVMTSKWKQLQFVIKNLSTSFLYGIATSGVDSITDEDLEHYHQLMPKSNGFLNHLCQILIWDFITTRILLKPTIVWGHDVSDSMMKFFKTIFKDKTDTGEITVSDFHTFRAQTGEILKNTTNIDPTVCDNWKAELKAQMRPFTPPENAQEVSDQLDNIIYKAVALAVIVVRARCHYEIEPFDRSFECPFDANTMDDVDGDEDEDSVYVHCIISPALFKHGNSKGENYEERIVLAKAAVLCRNRA